jgi:hypothetical protein
MKFRFGGVIGKEALTAIVALAVLGIIAFRVGKENVYLLWGCLVGVVLITLSAVIAMGFHGHKHPLEATLEGGEMVILQQLRQEVAAKGMAEIPHTLPVQEGVGHKALKDAKES